MKVVVFGSRSWTEAWIIYRRLRELPAGTTIVHGASPGGGADVIAAAEALGLGLEVVAVPISDVDRAVARTSKQAPIIRTIRMFNEHPDVELALGFMDGDTPGSSFTRAEARRRGVPVEIVVPREWEG